MKAKLISQQNNLTYNQCVQNAYNKILKQAKSLLSSIEAEPLRYTLIRQDKVEQGQSTIVHELISPLLYLRLERSANDELHIHFGWEFMPVFCDYYNVTTAFVRTLYKLMMDGNSPINIEQALRIDWVINNCSEAYEQIEERQRHHSFQLVKYKPKPVKRKLQRVA